MKMKSILLNLVFFASLIGIGRGGDEEEHQRKSALFVFGDSLYDPGNNNYINTTMDYQADFSPYGESFFEPPSGRFSDGRLIPDFIAEFAKLPLIEAYLKPGDKDFSYGTNFASGGGGALVGTHRGFVIDLHMQLSYFNKVEKRLRKKLGDANKAKTLLSDAVYMFSIGGNDYIEPITTDPSFFDTISKREYVDLVLGNLTEVIKGVYKKGGRKFVFVTMPPLEALPNLKLQSDNDGGMLVGEAIELATIHNVDVPKLARTLEAELEGFKYSFFDLHFFLSQIINNPSKYGFKDATKACCGSGRYNGIYSCGGKRPVSKTYELCKNTREYVFFDSFHPSEEVYKQLAELLWNGDSDVISPYNVKSLFKF